MQDPRTAELEAIAARAVDAVAGGEPFDAAVPAFLMRHYLATGDEALAGPLGLALTEALAHAELEPTVLARAAWLALLVEATAVAEDERILSAAVELIGILRAACPHLSRIDEVSATVEACLRAVEIVGPDELVQDAIDQLERVIGGSYRPGEGLVRSHNGLHVRCSIDDHVRGASALLTAFALTGRLPYSMLAEELMAVVKPPAGADLVVQCEAAGVLCRLAALHDDPDYRGAVVIATGADYRAEAARILAGQSDAAHAGTASAAAAYGLALLALLK